MGYYIFPVNRNFLSLSGGTVTGETLFTGNLSAATYYSGSTELSVIINNLIANGSTGGTVTLFTSNVGNGVSPLSAYTTNTLSFRTFNIGSNLGITTGDTIIYYLKDDISLNSITATTLSAQSISASTIQSNSLMGGSIQMVVANTAGVLSVQAIPAAGQSTIVRNGQNTFTAGTTADYSVNVSGLTVDNIIVSGTTARFNVASATTFSASTYYSGSTELGTLFVVPGQLTNSNNNIATLQSQMLTKVNRSGDTMTGLLTGTEFSGQSISATTFYSGSTDLSALFLPINGISSGVQNQLNTKVNRSGDTMTGNLTVPALSGQSISATTFYSGSTELGTLFVVPGQLTNSNNNIATLQVQMLTKVNRSGDTMTGLLTGTQFSGQSISGSTIQSNSLIGGSTQMVVASTSGILSVQSIPSAGQSTIIRNGTNTYTAGTIADYSVNVSGLSIDNIIVSGTTYLNGSTTFLGGRLVFNSPTTPQLRYSGDSSLTGFHFDGGDTISLHTNNFQRLVAVSAGTIGINLLTNSVDSNYKLHVSGNSLFIGAITAQTLSAQTIQSNSLVGGLTQMVVANTAGVLSVQSIPSAGQSTVIRNGQNTFTAGTTADYSVNVSGLTVDNIIVSGTTARFNIASATTFSATTYYSGSTELSVLFGSANVVNLHTLQLNTKVNRSGDTMTGLLTSTQFSGQSISATTFYSGTTDLSSLFVTSGQLANSNGNITTLQAQMLTKVNRSGDTMTGNLTVPALSGQSISATTFYSGSTELGTLFVVPGQLTNSNNNIATLQAQMLTKVNRSGDTMTGLLTGTQFSGQSVSATTFYSGSTDLSLLFGNAATTSIQNGINTFTGGTSSNPTINVTALTINTLTASGNTTLSGSLTQIDSSNFNVSSKITLLSTAAPQIRYTGQTSTGLHFDGNNNLSLHSGSYQTLVATSGGTVGIGFSNIGSINESNKLHVSGNSLFSGSISATTLYSGTTDLSSLFVVPGQLTNSNNNIATLQAQMLTKVNRSGDTMTGLLTGTEFSGQSISATTFYSGSSNINQLFADKTHNHIGGIGFRIDGGGGVITTGFKGYVIIPYSGTITSWKVISSISGTAIVDVWKDSYQNFPPTVADSISGSEKITLSSQTKNQNTTISSWSKEFNAGDIFAFNVDTVSTVTDLTVIMDVVKFN